MSFIVGEVVASINGDTNPFRRAINESRNMGTDFAQGFGKQLKGVGDSLSGLGKKITKYLTVPIMGASTAAFVLGKDFESELSKVTGLVGVASDQTEEWGQDILALAPSLGKAPKELAEALFFVTSAGIKGSEAMDVLAMSGKASAAGLGETKTIADLVTSAMNAYGVENLSASTATDILVAAVREGKAEASELAASMGQVLPLASNMGVTFDQVAAAQAAMTRTGTPATEAATQLKGILAGLIKPSQKAEEQLQAMGTSSQEMRKKIKDEGLITALFDLKEMTNKYGEEAMARVFPNIRALMGTLDLMGASAEDNAEIFDKVKNSTGALDKAFQTATETTEFKWNAALSALKVVAIDLWGVLKGVMIPILEKVTSVLEFVSQKFKELSPIQQQLILVFGGLAAAIGPVLVIIGGAIAAVGTVIASLVTIITGLSAVIGTVGLPVLASLGVAFGAIIAIVTAVIGIISAFVAGFVALYKNNEEFRENVNNTWNSIKESAMVIFSEIKKTIESILNGIKVFWKAHGEEIMNFVKVVWNYILTNIEGTMAIIKNVIKIVCSIIRGDWRGAWEAVKNLLKNVSIQVKRTIKNLWEVIKSLFKLGKSILISVTRGIVKGVVNLFSSLAKSAVSKLRSMKDGLAKAFRAAKDKGIQLIKDMVVGIGKKLLGLNKEGSNAGKRFIKAITSIDFAGAGGKIVSGIIRGIKSKIGALGSAANQIGSTIRNRLPFSPAKEGPLRDLNKVNFSSSIVPKLKDAEKEIMNSFLGNMMLGKINPIVSFEDFNSSKKETGLILNNAKFDFHGVKDVIGFMKEMKRTLRRYGGTF